MALAWQLLNFSVDDWMCAIAIRVFYTCSGTPLHVSAHAYTNASSWIIFTTSVGMFVFTVVIAHCPCLRHRSQTSPVHQVPPTAGAAALGFVIVTLCPLRVPPGLYRLMLPPVHLVLLGFTTHHHLDCPFGNRLQRLRFTSIKLSATKS